MKLLKRIRLSVSTAFTPTRGKIMEGKWDKITEYLKRNDLPIKSAKEISKIVIETIPKV